MDTLASAALPRPACTIEVRLDDGVATPVRRFGKPDGPRLLLSHGNGLAIDLYYPFWSLLLEVFDLVLFDLRNHGRNPVGDIAGHTIPAFCRDLEAVGQAVDRAFGARPRAGIFHSVSCLASLLSPSLGTSYEALVLFDPSLHPTAAAQWSFDAACQQAAQRTRIRAARFRTEEEFIELMRPQPALSRVVPGVLRWMAGATLRPVPGGGFELRCPREHEAAVMAALPGFARMVDLDALPIPVKVIGADPALQHYFIPPCSPIAAASVDYEFLPGTTHLAQLEKPVECAARTVGFLRRQRFVRR